MPMQTARDAANPPGGARTERVTAMVTDSPQAANAARERMCSARRIGHFVDLTLQITVS